MQAEHIACRAGMPHGLNNNTTTTTAKFKIRTVSRKSQISGIGGKRWIMSN